MAGRRAVLEVSCILATFLIIGQYVGSSYMVLDPLWSTSKSRISARGRALRMATGDEVTLNEDIVHDTLHNDDFVFVAAGHKARLQLLEASRYWRKGMRAVFVLEEPEEKLPTDVVSQAGRFRESFAWYPNFRRMANDKRDHYLEGDRRGALAPVLAYAAMTGSDSFAAYTKKSTAASQMPGARGDQHETVPPRQEGQQRISVTNASQPRSLQSSSSSKNSSLEKADVNPHEAQPYNRSGDPFKWMLVGDDDTIYFMHGVKTLLKDYDPQLPYLISDYLFAGSTGPNPGVWELRCYPCHLQWGKWRRRALQLLDGDGNAPSKGCGCSTQELCRRRFPGNETRCQYEWEGPIPYGGNGYIMSIGLFKWLASLKDPKYGDGLLAYEKCINAPESSCMTFPEGSDAFLGRCFFRLGTPLTDPGYTKLGRYFGEVLHLNFMYDAAASLSRGALPPDALTRWSLATSMHLFARQRKSIKVAALTIKYIVGVYDLIAEMLWPTNH